MVANIVEEFRTVYLNSLVWAQGQTTWLGVPVSKCPLDLWIYQEVLGQVRPDVVVETGTYLGGSTLFMAGIMDNLQKGRIITIDLNKFQVPQHPRIIYLNGSSVAPEIFAQVNSLINPGERVLVILDSDHSREHVLNEMRLYANLVDVGSYLIVEDTNMPGPAEAVEEFMKSDSRYTKDLAKEKFLLTFNPGGYLFRYQA
jgi:cephalosporin hydroxylase